ncbi:MAG: hypothetical protein LIP11_17275 [Clostridiales bacterium]|nr:hypothetical protein [Clostridiales bacterium]
MKKKEYVQFSVDNPLQYHMTGKFVAPSESWIHQEAPLDDFELFIVTDDVLYIEHGGTQYTVENGEFLLLPPLTGPDSHRKGFHPSRCSFYWLHFLPANPYTLYQGTPLRTLFPKTASASHFSDRFRTPASWSYRCASSRTTCSWATALFS